MAKKQRTAREALVEVLTKNGGEMTPKDIIAAAIPLATGLTTDTRKGTLYGTLREEALKPDGKIVKTGKGLYKARAVKVEAEVTPDPKPAKAPRKNSRKRMTQAKEPVTA